jgi:hypothetical protein
VKVAQEYQIVYALELDENGRSVGELETVEGQMNIYDTVPGMDRYSPITSTNCWSARHLRHPLSRVALPVHQTVAASRCVRIASAIAVDLHERASSRSTAHSSG